MKMMKRIATLFLAVCLMMPGFSMVTNAASGQIMFTDPETAVGQTVEVKGVLKADCNIEDRKISMTYDTTMLKFVEGENVTESSDGQLTYEVKGQKDSERVEFLMKFDALKEGETKVEAVSYDAWSTENEQIDCVKGASTIKIEAGEAGATQEPTDVEVYVDGVAYTLASTFEDSVMPEGFQKTQFDYQGTMCTAATNENASMFLGYLVDESGAGEFFLYMMETASFVPYEALKISETMTIALLPVADEVVLSEQFTPTEVIVNGKTYPAWQNDASHYILYALNSNGEKALYQYDSEEGTYQRFVAPEVEEEQVEESKLAGLVSLLEGNMSYVVLAAGLGFILLVLIIIILSVKLCNRNAELDELYEEYGLVEEDGEAESDTDDERSEDGIVILDDDSDKSEDFVVFDDSEEFFVDISDEIEDDIVFEENDEEIEVEFFEQTNKEEIVLEQKVVKKEVEKEEYLDDNDEDFEFDFIDLDD